MKMLFYNVDIKMQDSEIRTLVINGLNSLNLMASDPDQDGGMMSIDGFDRDPRELWQIPEVVNFAKKLVAMGVMSILTISTYLNPKFGQSKESKPFGAFELWLLAKEELGNNLQGEKLIGMFEKFKQDLMISNESATDVMTGLVSDGSHKV